MRRARGVMAVGLVLGLTAACSSDDEPSPSDGEPSPSEVAACRTEGRLVVTALAAYRAEHGADAAPSADDLVVGGYLQDDGLRWFTIVDGEVSPNDEADAIGCGVPA